MKTQIILSAALAAFLVGCASKLHYTPEVRKMSYASDRLFRDMVNAISGVKFADEVFFQNVEERRLIAIEAIVPYDNRRTGIERWTVQHDGTDSCTYHVEFIPDGKGGTYFTVEKEDGDSKP